MKYTRRKLLKNGLLFTGLLASGGLTGLSRGKAEEKSCEISSKRIEEIRNNIISGGPPPDGIPPIEKPGYVTAQNITGPLGGLLEEDSVVIGLNYNGQVKAFPRSILVYHEIVNEVAKGEKISVTYCPLTGSAIGYKGKINSLETTFGTSGKLVNSNLVMYDRENGTDSYWSQILGRSLSGPHKGKSLEQFPLIWTTWGRWRENHPETLVLTTDTGHSRPYERDPYGSYREKGTYYQTGSPNFPVMAKSDRFPPKKVVTGIKVNGCTIAVPKDEFRKKVVVNISLGGEPVAVIYDRELDAVRAFERRLGGSTLEFSFREGKLIDRDTGSEWKPDGSAIEGSMTGENLTPVTFFDVMWFGWYAFYPETRVLTV